jgi:hypothetical protein
MVRSTKILKVLVLIFCSLVLLAYVPILVLNAMHMHEIQMMTGYVTRWKIQVAEAILDSILAILGIIYCTRNPRHVGDR